MNIYKRHKVIKDIITNKLKSKDEIKDTINDILANNKIDIIKFIINDDTCREILIEHFNNGYFKKLWLDFFAYGYIRNHPKIKDKLHMYINYKGAPDSFYSMYTYYNPYE